MKKSSRSLLDFLDTPVVVGDPDGRAVYANPVFLKAFGISSDESRGKPLAELFEGGGREGVLQAVARVCEGSASVRFRLRDGEIGYAAMASPIEAEQGRVGVLILLTEELFVTDLGPSMDRDVQEALDELSAALAELSEGIGGRRNPQLLSVLDDAGRCVERLRKRYSGIRPGSAQR